MENELWFILFEINYVLKKCYLRKKNRKKKELAILSNFYTKAIHKTEWRV